MARVVYSDIAKADLREIWDYALTAASSRLTGLSSGFAQNSNTLPNGTPLAALAQKWRGIAAAIPSANTVSFFDLSTMALRSFV